MRPRGAIVIVLAAALAGASSTGAADPPSRPCMSVVPYAGSPLHAALPESLFAGVGGDLTRPLPAALSAALDSVASWVLERTGAPGMTAAVGIPGEGMWSTARGLARVTPLTPLGAEPLFYWASAGKAYTAAVVAQMVEEGKLGLGDTLARWFPDVPNARFVTVDHMLTHTSGIFSFNNDLKFREKRGYTAPEELIRIAARHGSDFCPGEHWYYSNTGYVLLARIIEKLEGRAFHEVVAQRIIERLGLRHTRALAPRERAPGLATGHVGRKPDADFDPTVPFGAGAIAASAGDMILFWQAILAGRLVQPGTIRHAYQDLYPMFDPGTYYGRGVMLTEFRAGQGPLETWLGHSGGTPSAKAVFAWDVRSRAFVAVAINGDVSVEAAAVLLLAAAQGSRDAGGR